MKKHILCITLLSSFLYTCISQSINIDIKDVVLPPPTASSLGKYGDIPVSYHTGIPQIGIPIYTLKEGSLSLPISLSYHAGGLKVGELSSNIGRGWALQAGGMISRTVQGKPDEAAGGYFSTGTQISVGANGCINGSITNQQLASGTHDSEPDVFSFSAGGYSGKFFIEADNTNDGIINGNVVMIPKMDLIISYTVDAAFSAQRIKNFKILLPNGDQYLFGNIDASPTNHGIEIMESNDNTFWRANGWYLRQIRSADGNQIVNLNYTNEVYNYKYRVSSGHSLAISGAYPYTTPSGYIIHKVDINGWRINTITTTNETITFVAGANRSDLDNAGSSSPAKELDQIQITTGIYCKSFDLSQSYFQDNSPYYSNDENDMQLRLNSVTEKSCNGTIVATPFILEYYGKTGNENYLPTRLSPAFDHWGYYNDAVTNPKSGLNIPATRLAYNNGTTNLEVVKGSSNRETSEEPMRWGTLKKITYPTGGSTSFEYEANSYYGSRDTVSFTNQESLNMFWQSGQCGMFTTPVATFTKTISAADLPSLWYQWDNKQADYYTGCNPWTGPYSTIRLVQVSNNSVLATTTASAPGIGPNGNPILSKLAKLTDLFTGITIPTGVSLRFEIMGSNVASLFSLKKITYGTASRNFIAGGLRIKKITQNDGMSIANDISRFYTYVNNNIPSQSSAVLFNMPKYGYIYSGCIGQCNGIVNGNNSTCPSGTYYNTHFFVESSIVPLSAFEGQHLGYTSVREYFTNSASGHYNLYQFFNDAPPLFDGKLPVHPVQPRIGNGEMSSKAIRNAASADIAYDILTKNTETDQLGLGTYLRFNTYNNDAGGASITFWKKYTMATMPFRYSSIQSVLDGVSTTVTKTYAASGHLQPITEGMINSDGKTTTTEYKYFTDLTATLPPAQVTAFQTMNLKMPLQIIVKVGINTVNGTKTDYAFYNTTTGSFSSTGTGGSSVFLRPYTFSKYEVTYNSSQVIQPGAWVIKGTVNAYHGTSSSTGKAGFPRQYTKTNWATEEFQWTNSGLIKQRKFQNFIWNYNYHLNTNMVSAIQQPDLQTVSYSYDAMMRLSQVSSRGNNINNYFTYAFPTLSGGIISIPGYVKTQNTYTSTTFSDLTNEETFQYFDGLGRGIQTVKKAHATNGKDVILATSYDTQGRLMREYVAFSSAHSTGLFISSIPGGTANKYTTYDANSLNRVASVTPPGWTATHISYNANAGTEVVGNGFTGNYAASSLFKTTETDPQNNQSITYTDKKGRVVMTRKLNGLDAMTHNSYDDKDRIYMVVPPGVSSIATQPGLLFTYLYDGADNMIKKKVPDANENTMVYNNRDLLAYSQDGNLAAQGKHLANEYDIYGRITRSGFSTLSNLPNVPAFLEVLQENFYDGWDGSSQADLGVYPIYKTRLRKSRTKIVGSTSDYINNVYSYDTYGRNQNTVGNNHLTPNSTNSEIINRTFDFADNVTTENRSHTNGITPQNFNQRTVYDHQGRLYDYFVSIGGVENHTARYGYNERNEMTERNQHYSGAAWLQSVDYNYNDQGWLTAINQSALGNTGTPLAFPICYTSVVNPPLPLVGDPIDSKDLFFLQLQYNTLYSGLAGSARSDGNITQQIWRVRGRQRQAFSYTYDGLQRIQSASYSDINESGTATASGRYNTSYTYNDLRGNFLNVQRNGLYLNGSCYIQALLDNMTYSYTVGTNKISSITDAASTSQGGFRASSGTFTYDANGNIKSYPSKGISNINYNYLNLPTLIDFGGEKVIEFTYDAVGNKLRKVVKNTGGGIALTQDYLSGIEYKNGTIESIFHSEGRLYNNGGWKREYSIKDHLGNTRIAYSDLNTDGVISTPTEILQENHYDAFGLGLDGVYINHINPDNLYQYNGKEKNNDHGIGLNDHVARFYDPSLARWIQTEPLIDFNPSQSSYSFVSNMPISFSDPTGFWQETEDGWTTNDANEIQDFHNALTNVGNQGFSVHRGDGYDDEAFRFIPNDLTGVHILYDRSGKSPESNRQNSPASLYSERNAFGYPTGKGAIESVDDPITFLLGGVIKKLGTNLIYSVSTTTTKAGTTVLGHYPEYVNLAKKLKARVLNIPTNIWNKMTLAEQWAANQKFLDRMILRGDNIRLATPLNLVKPGSFYQKELNYLFSKGYKVSSDGFGLIK